MRIVFFTTFCQILSEKTIRNIKLYAMDSYRNNSYALASDTKIELDHYLDLRGRNLNNNRENLHLPHSIDKTLQWSFFRSTANIMKVCSCLDDECEEIPASLITHFTSLHRTSIVANPLAWFQSNVRLSKADAYIKQIETRFSITVWL